MLVSTRYALRAGLPRGKAWVPAVRAAYGIRGNATSAPAPPPGHREHLNTIIPHPGPTPDLANPPASFSEHAAGGNLSEGIEVVQHQLGDLAALGLCNWTPAGLCQALLEGVHVLSGLPWWLTIGVTAVGMRFALLPLVIEQTKKGAIMAKIGPKLQELQKEAKAARLENNQHRVQETTRSMQKLFQSNNISPFSTLKFPIVSGAVFMSFYIGIQGMCNLPVPGLTSGGFGWIHDLTARDPYYIILPVINAALVQINFKLGSDSGTQNSAMSVNMRRIFTALIWAMPLLTMNFQAAVFSYWIPTQVFAMFQGILLRNPRFRARMKLPEMPKPAAQPIGANTPRQGVVASAREFFQSIKESAQMRVQEEQRRVEAEVRQKSLKNRGGAGSGSSRSVEQALSKQAKRFKSR